MTTVIIPAKSFARAKSRLQPALDGPSRAALARRLFEHVLDVARAVDGTDVLVVTDGDDVEATARPRGIRCVRDPGEPPLRLAVDLGLEVARSKGQGAALVLMADLPWVTEADVVALVSALDRADVVVGPDTRRLGTNALALRPGVSMPTAFGRDDSFREHLARAEALGLRAHVHESPSVAFDVDTPADLRAMTVLTGRRAARSGSVDPG